MEYSVLNNQVNIITHYNKEFVNSVKLIPGRTFDPITKIWSVPVNLVTTPMIHELVQKFNMFKTGDEDLCYTPVNDQIEILKPEVKKTLEFLKLNHSPRDYQLDGICYSLISKKVLNGSDMGTGKTYTTIFTIEVGDLFPCLLVVPASVKYNWEMQWKKINPNREVYISNGKFESKDVVITTYDSLGKNIIADGKKKVVLKNKEILDIGFKSIVCDESQNIKESKTVRSKALKKIIKGVGYIFLLTGTPVMNRPSELINPLNILGYFNTLFGSWKNYIFRYCDAKETRFGLDYSGASNLKELNERLSRLCYFVSIP